MSIDIIEKVKDEIEKQNIFIVAGKCEISPATIKAWIDGDAYPGYASLKKLANYFKEPVTVNPDDKE